MSMDHFRLFPDDTDPLLRYKADAERRERELAAEREREEQRTESREATLLRAEVEALRSELQQLRDEIDARRQDDLKNLADVTSSVADVIERLPDWIESVAKKSHIELRALIAERFGELLGQINAIMPDARSRAAKGESFEFANERQERDDDAITELPNPLARRRAIN